MRYAEPIAALRRIPVYLENSSGAAITGVTITAGELKISKSGASFVNGGGTWTEVGSGNYYYEATLDEVTTDSFVMIRVADPAALTFVYAVDIGNRIEQNEPLAAARRIPIYLVDADDVPVTGVTLTGSEIQISLNGGTFANATGTSVETGLGAYYYEATLTDVGTEGFAVLKVTDVAVEPYIYTFDVFVSDVPVDVATSGYFGAYFGGDEVEAGGDDDDTPAPIEVSITLDIPAATQLDHVQAAIDRLCEQFKEKQL